MEEYLLKRIEVNPKIMIGKPVIKGTRIPVDLIVRLFATGLSMQDILEDYPQLTEEDIKAALLYASKVVANEEVLLTVVGES
ncbi:MAG: DUF433 domain-containing protein [Euryarchaeota archaeon]|nr:DUF433 domain-containing protein [Euryarchaeota archaeon]